MKKVLFVGEHPHCGTGNGNMMASIFSTIDVEKYEVSCFCVGDESLGYVDIFKPYPIHIIEAGGKGGGPDSTWGYSKLVQVIDTFDLDIVVFVGLDVWRYGPIYPNLDKIRKARKKLKFVALFPYDFHMVRKDMFPYISFFDLKLVYSEYGYETLSPHFPDIQYFRPPLYGQEDFKPLPESDVASIRRKMFPQVRQDSIVVGFIGNNQIRKDPQRFIKAFYKAREEDERLVLYMHTDMNGVYDLATYSMDCGARTGTIFAKEQGKKYSQEEMVKVYNAIDICVNCSLQEGLSWVPIEVMLCGTPTVLSFNTAHKELCKGGSSVAVDSEELVYVPIGIGNSSHWVESKACSVEDIKSAILYLTNENISGQFSEKGRIFAKEWVSRCHDINEPLGLLDPKLEITSYVDDAVLFAQHSSAGDVLMTTQCFKGIKDRHPGKKLVYMTMPSYMGVVENNPHIDQIIPWEESNLRKYRVVYNPHGEKILPGGFNNLDDTLYSMYPFFCGVEADEMFIYCNGTSKLMELLDTSKDIIVVQTAGGQKEFRTYQHMDIVLGMLEKDKYTIVQVGSKSDPLCQYATIDLRDSTTWTESAYIMHKAKAAIVIDSFPSHLAGVLGTPTIVLYGPAPARVTRPRDDKGCIINLEPDRKAVCPVLSNCWGKPGYKACESPCINTINPMVIYENLIKLLG